MALNFPNTPTDGQNWVDPNGQTWVYKASDNSWTAKGAPSGGMVYRGGIDITAAPPAGASTGWLYTVTTGGTPNAGFTGLTGTIASGAQVVNSGANWQQIGTTGPWTRSGTELSPVTAGDSVFTSGAVKVGGTTAAPNITVKADGGIVANTSGLVYDAATKRLIVGRSAETWGNRFEVVQTENNGNIGALRYTANNNGVEFNFIKSRGVTAGANAIVVAGDELARINFKGADGSSYIDAARILAVVDGTPGANDMPGRLEFYTTADGASIPTERMRLDSSGRLGLGNTAPDSTLTVKGATGVTPLRISGPSSELARIDASGRLLVGTSSDVSGGNGNALLQCVAPGPGTLVFGRSDGSTTSDAALGNIFFRSYAGSAWETTASIQCIADATQGLGDKPSRLVFSTCSDSSATPVERLRITSAGTQRVFSSSNDTIEAAISAAAGTTENLYAGRHGATGTNTGTLCFVVRSNGNVLNTNNSYGALSDIKLKENIVDANSQWADLKALQVRNYNFKEDRTHTQIGLVAQEVELISPGLVSESPDRDAEGNDLGTVTKSVNYSVLYMKAVKALQEAMERIEQLEAKVAALESK